MVAPHRPVFQRKDKCIPAQSLINALLEVAESRGASRAKLLRGTGIFDQDLAPETLFSPKQILTLVENCQSHCRSIDLSFQTGQSLATTHLNSTIYGLKTCRSMSHVLRIMALFPAVFSPFVAARHYAYLHTNYYVFEDRVGCSKRWQFFVELYSAFLVTLSRELTGKRVPYSFEFAFSRPRHIQQFEEHLGYRLSFNAPLTTFSLPAGENPPVQYADALMGDVWRAQLHRIAPAHLFFLDDVRQRIAARPHLTLNALADELTLSVSTLKRKLKEHGTSFNILDDEINRQRAIHLLCIRQVSNEQGALHMAFNDITNFRRAVKRWTGCTPSQLRSLRSV